MSVALAWFLLECGRWRNENGGCGFKAFVESTFTSIWVNSETAVGASSESENGKGSERGIRL